jgi:hypothetical protein
MVIMRYFIVGIILSMIFGGCAESEQLNTQPLTTSKSIVFTDAWQTRWLRGEPCAPPCWENITPGQTTADEAFQLLKKRNEFTKLVTKYPESQSYGLISWEWLSSNDSNNSEIRGGLVVFNANDSNKIIYFIAPKLAQFGLGDIIKKYGEPTHVIASATPNPPSYSLKFTLYILYLNDKSFLISNEFSEIPQITADLWVGNIKFFKPNLQPFTELQVGEKEQLVEWKGYKDFRYYCREYRTGKPCSK